GLSKLGTHRFVDDGAEDNRAHPVRGSDLVDTLDHFGDALGGIDERHRLALKIEFFELGQQAVPEHLRSDAGAIRNEEDGAACRQWLALCWYHHPRHTGVVPTGNAGISPTSIQLSPGPWKSEPEEASNPKTCAARANCVVCA